MKCILVLAGVLSTVFAIDVYPTKYDNIDIDEILNNKRLVDQYTKCLLNQGKCNEEGTTLKEVIPDALITGCSKCNPIQKTKTDKVIKFLISNRKADWNALRQLYDPSGQYYENYEHLLH